MEHERIIDYIVHFWKTHLLPHFAEEDLLFKQVEDPLVQRAYAEHHQLHTVLERLKSASPDDKSALIPEIADLVDHHVRFEERELFPHLEQAIPESQLAIIGQRLREAQPEPLQDDYEDQFWN